MTPGYPTTSNVFKSFGNGTMFSDLKNGKEKRTIFGNDIPQTAKAKPDPRSAACCVTENGGIMPAGGFKMNAFYSTIWSKNLRNVLSNNMAFGEDCCND
jgi:hypothetical protein